MKKNQKKLLEEKIKLSNIINENLPVFLINKKIFS